MKPGTRVWVSYYGNSGWQPGTVMGEAAPYGTCGRIVWMRVQRDYGGPAVYMLSEILTESEYAAMLLMQ